jgi:De-etiolated protein 1 Det1
MMQGLRQRLLTFLFLRAAALSSRMQALTAIQRYFLHFDTYAELVVWKVSLAWDGGGSRPWFAALSHPPGPALRAGALNLARASQRKP